MMRRRVVIPALVLSTLAALPQTSVAQFSDPKPPSYDVSQRFSAQQLDNLVGPVALYPDALLAQVLVASTFPEQVQDAADFVRSFGTDSIDVQSWDISVKAVAHYPSALNTMADKIDWTAALGKAYANQSSDVMSSVQRLRRMAADQGNLNSTPQQKIVTTNETVQIVPVEPRVIYVPVYDPYVIYSRPIFDVGFTSRYFSWGVGFPIGSWLIYDCDWGTRRVYYNGWSPSYYGYGGGWRQRSRPFIRVTNIYINPRYTNVYVNRSVGNRSINYYNVDRYASVHSGHYFDGRRDGRYDTRDDGRNNSRYAVRKDGNSGVSAINGGGYSNGGAVNGGGYSAGNGGAVNGGYNTSDATGRNRDARGINSERNGPSGRDGDGNVARDGNGKVGRDGNGNVAPDGFSDRTTRDGSRRDGNGNRIGNPAARPPEQRRAEPANRPEQSVRPERQSAPAQQVQSQRVQPQRERMQRAEPQRTEAQGSQPQRVESQRSAPQPGAGDVRTARRRGSSN